MDSNDVDVTKQITCLERDLMLLYTCLDKVVKILLDPDDERIICDEIGFTKSALSKVGKVVIGEDLMFSICAMDECNEVGLLVPIGVGCFSLCEKHAQTFRRGWVRREASNYATE